MTYLVAQLIEDIRDELHGEFHQEWNLVNGAQTNSETTIEFLDVMLGIGIGSVLYVNSTGELMYVRDAPSGSSATVVRGFRGTTATAIAANAQVEVNPRFPPSRIRRAIQDEVRSWPSTLYTATLETISVGHGARHGALSRGDAYRILEVRRAASDTVSTRDTFPIAPRPWDITRAGPSASAGYGVQIGETIPAGDLYVLYAVPFNTSAIDDGVDLQDDMGLLESMNDIVRWGVCWRLISREEIDRTDMSEQGQPRDAQEIAPNEQSTLARYYLSMRNMRIAQEADRLRAYYPMTRG